MRLPLPHEEEVTSHFMSVTTGILNSRGRPNQARPDQTRPGPRPSSLRISPFLHAQNARSYIIACLYFYCQTPALLSILSLSPSNPVLTSPIPKHLRGIAPPEEYYLSNVIKWKDGSKIFDKEKLNDDFCDCPDGTDEPDCCDGSDEYDGKVECPNTCQEAGKVAGDELLEKIQRHQEGVAIRKKEEEEAKQAMGMDEAELSRLKDEEKILAGLVGQLRVSKEQMEKAEEQENRKKEEEQKRLIIEAEKNAGEQGKQQVEIPQDETEGVEKEISEELDPDSPWLIQFLIHLVLKNSMWSPQKRVA